LDSAAPYSIVLVVIDDQAARTCRVSIRTVSKPASATPRANHSESGPGSKPTSSRHSGRRFNNSASAFASLGMAFGNQRAFAVHHADCGFLQRDVRFSAG
jgi:hypothetical protein